MQDHFDVASHSPILFVKGVCEAIADGYQVCNTIPGYPQFGPYVNTIRLFKGEKPSGVVVPSEFNGRVEHYDPMSFMLLVQTFVHAGYTFKDGGQHFFDEKGLKSVEMELATEVVKEEKPVQKKAQKKPLKAEPTSTEMKEAK